MGHRQLFAASKQSRSSAVASAHGALTAVFYPFAKRSFFTMHVGLKTSSFSQNHTAYRALADAQSKEPCEHCLWSTTKKKRTDKIQICFPDWY